jgi:CRP/FNR family transcriptional regulator, anaerobic regulatory protein
MIDFLKKQRLSETQICELLSKSETIEAKKKTILLKEGEICTHIYFVKSGILRAAVHDEDKRDWTHCFYSPEGLMWAGLSANCLLQKPSDYFIEVLEDATIIAFPVIHFRELRRSNMQWSRFFNCQLMESFHYLEQKSINQVKFTPEKRYQAFTEKYPKLLQSIPQHYIASYIGVLPESLSRIRKRLNVYALN